MWFKIIGPIHDAEVLAEASSLPALRRRLRQQAKVDPASVIGRAECLNAGEYKFDVRVGRKYRVLRPGRRDSSDVIRIVDGSGEDYLYPRDWFRMCEPRSGSVT